MNKLPAFLFFFFSIAISFSSTLAAPGEEEVTSPSAEKGIFNRKMANSYDERTENKGVKEALFEAAKKILKDSPEKAKVLCVGAGTGSEIVALAQSFPQWTFVAVDPSSDMLEKARGKLQTLGLLDRVQLHVGTLETLPDDGKLFDIATSILVSHFVREEKERQTFFRNIAEHLNPGGRLITADLVSSSAGSKGLFQPWLEVLKESGFPYKELEERGEALSAGQGVPFLHIDTFTTLLSSSGFQQPIQFYQWLYIHGFIANTNPQ